MATIPVIVLVVIHLAVSPFGLGRESAQQGDHASGCASPDASLVMERDGAMLLVDPHAGAVRDVPVSADIGRIVERGQVLLGGIVPGRWHVARSSGSEAHRIVVTDRRSGARVFDVAFDRRIELSTSASSLSGRFTIYVQGNNVASEVTVLDAANGQVRTVHIEHDARLAAFAVGVAIDPGETCAAISMERAGSDGAETWLLDLHAGEARILRVPDAFVLGWVRGQV